MQTDRQIHTNIRTRITSVDPLISFCTKKAKSLLSAIFVMICYLILLDP
jgi:hypothetical protein